MKQQILDILESLIACDTQNPPRCIEIDHPIFDVLRKNLVDFEIETIDHQQGRISFLARRGHANRLFNVHLDTVPIGEGWTKPPLQMTARGDQVFGRGVCDNKGAAACLLAFAETSKVDMAVLFTTDEEGTDPCCVEQFCKSHAIEPFQLVIVAEPTQCKPVTAHRGYLSVRGGFGGIGGHTSRADRLPHSANHRAIHWAHETLQRVGEIEQNRLGGKSCCFNIGRVEGGTKNNVVADSCFLSWSARLPPTVSIEQFMDWLFSECDDDSAEWQTTFHGQSFPHNSHDRQLVEAWLEPLQLGAAGHVDFWTEASIFSRVGRPTLVLGPGDIRQAHTADEWTTTEQLELAVDAYRRLATEPIGRLAGAQPTVKTGLNT